MNEYEIVELTPDDLVKCSSFWGYPNARLEEFLKSGARKVFAYKTGDKYVGDALSSSEKTNADIFRIFV